MPDFWAWALPDSRRRTSRVRTRADLTQRRRFPIRGPNRPPQACRGSDFGAVAGLAPPRIVDLLPSFLGVPLLRVDADPLDRFDSIAIFDPI